MNERNGKNGGEELERLLREAHEPMLGASLYPRVRARIASRRDAITGPIRLAGGLAMAAGILLGVFLAEDPVSQESGAAAVDEETVALLTYGQAETLDTAFLSSFTDESLR